LRRAASAFFIFHFSFLICMRDLFFKDLGWKIFSVLLAAGIWLTVHRILLESPEPASPGGTSTLTCDRPVTIVAGSADVREFRPLQPTVSVTVSGPPEVIGKLEPDQIRARVDLTDAGLVKSSKLPVEISVPAGITVVRIKPETIGVIPPPPKQ
jgi:YbbR domain-containing protein